METVMAARLELDDFDREVLSLPPLPFYQTDSFVEQRRPAGFPSSISHPRMLDRENEYGTPYGVPPAYLFPAAQIQPRPALQDRAYEVPHRSNMTRAPAYHLREPPRSSQWETAALQSASYQLDPPSTGSTTSRFPALGSSSPTARLSARKQKTAQTLPASDSSQSLDLSPPGQPPRVSQFDPTFPTPVVHGIPLVSLRQALPDKFRTIFPYELFNAVQSKCFNVVYGTNDNVVVAAPTGSGKTTILELAICKLALDRGNENFKIVYQAPTKALCSEKARDWEKKFSHMNLKCAELTGDTSQAEMRRVSDASIIVTTPEKWDSITRKWQDHRRLLQLVELFLIDEVHILKDVRGATLEAVVSRMKTIGANVRFIALSATVPNSDDIARWLGRNHTNQQLPAHREAFGEEFRPVKLQKFVYGFDSSSNDFIFDKFLDQKLPGLISKHTRRKPILVFCFTRKSCESTASMLAEYASGRSEGDKLWPVPTGRVAVVNRDLQEIVRFGVAFHHAGLDAQDRATIEQHFLKGQLGVICCTSTLAVGINLPCHTVVLKGTVGFTDEKLEEYSDLEVMQMLGRAGRPQFDDSATAIILTRATNKQRYEKMVSGQEILESTLHLNLIEHLNSEICLGTINSLSTAKTWLGGTFLSVRLRRNPAYYQLTGGATALSQIDEKLEEICERDIKQLQEAELVTEHNNMFKCTEYGLAMSKYMVEFNTMKLLLQIPRAVGMEALITILSQASEFKEFRFKPAERPLFREINQSPLILYPIKETVNQTRHKISLMIQAHLGCVQYPDSSEAAKVRRQLMVERKLVFERLNRLIRAVIDCKGYDRDSVGVRNALELARALAAGSWEGRATQLTQIPNIGPAGMRKLASKDIRTVLELADKTHDEIERLMSRQPPFGKNLQSHLEQFPRLAMDVVMVDKKIQPRSPDPVVIDVKATVRYLNHKGLPVWLQRVPALTFLAESNDGTLVYFWRGSMRKLDKQSGLELKFSVGLRDGRDCVTCYFSCEEIVGTIVSQTLEPKIPAAAFLTPPAQRNLVPVPRTKTSPRDYPNSDEIEDSDLLAAERALSQHANDTTEMEKEYPPVEDLLDLSPAESHEDGEEANLQFDASFDGEDEESSHTSMREPVQLPNGRWRCNHACSGGVPTRSGKPCTHRCCKEGIDKPRRRPLRRPKRNADEPVPGHATYAAAIGQSNVRQQQSGVAPSSRALGQTKRRKIQPMKSSTETSFATLSERPAISSKSGWEDLSDIDCIDLSFTDEEKDDTDALENRTNDSDQLPEKERKAPQQTAHKHAHKELRGQSNWPKATLTPNETARPSGPPSSGARTHDYFDDDDFSLDEELSASVTTAHIPTTTPFKSGASDEVLYQGIRKRFSETSSAPMSDKTAVSEAMPGVAEKPASSQQSSTLFVEQTPVKMATKQPDETLAMNESVTDRAAVTHQFGSDRTLKQDNEPDWVAQFDPELVNMFRGYVTFV